MGHGRPRGSGDQFRSVVFDVRDIGVVIDSTRVKRKVSTAKRHEERICLSLSTVYRSLFSSNSMLKRFVNLNLDASLSFLLLRTVPGNDPLSLCEVGPDGLWVREMSDSVKMRVFESTNLGGEVFKGSSLNRVDRELVVGMNGSETSRNLI